MSRRQRVRSPQYRARRQKRHAFRHYVIDEPLSGTGTQEDPFLGSRITEYRRGVAVGLEIIPPGMDADGVAV